MIALNWFYTNVLGNLVASVIWTLPTVIITLWNMERRQKRHQDQIHNQITQSMNSIMEKSK